MHTLVFPEEGWDLSLKRKLRPEWTRDRGGPRWNHAAAFLIVGWQFIETRCTSHWGGWDTGCRVVSAKLRPNETAANT